MSQRRLRWGALFVIVVGCASTPLKEPSPAKEEGRSPDIPAWVSTLPRDSTYIYAIGTCPKTYYKADAEAKALENARAELARSISIKVKSTVIDRQELQGQTGTFQQTSGEQSSQIDETVSEAVLKGSEVVAYWRDEKGIVGEAGTTYCLARIKHTIKGE